MIICNVFSLILIKTHKTGKNNNANIKLLNTNLILHLHICNYFHRVVRTILIKSSWNNIFMQLTCYTNKMNEETQKSIEDLYKCCDEQQQ